MQFLVKPQKSFSFKGTQSLQILPKFLPKALTYKTPKFLFDMKKNSVKQFSSTEDSDILPTIDQLQNTSPNQNARDTFSNQRQIFWSIDDDKFVAKGLQKKSKNYKSGHLGYNSNLAKNQIKNWSINSFKIIKKIGNGAYGKVYLAKQKISRMLVALKVICKQSVRINKVQQLIFRQIKIHLSQSHSNIVKLYHVFDDFNNIYMIEEYIGEGNLYELIKNKSYLKLSERRISKYMNQAIKAVKHLHYQNIMHRDLKLQNLLISNNVVKLCDFGCAVQTLELRGQKLGSLGYFSPEKLNNQLYSNKADVWSLGVIAYQLFFGKGPFEKDIVKIVHEGKKNHQFSELVFPKNISIQAKDFISKMLEKNPQNRIRLAEASKHPFITKYRQSQGMPTKNRYF